MLGTSGAGARKAIDQEETGILTRFFTAPDSLLR